MARHGPTGRSTGRAAEPATGLRPRTNMHVHGYGELRIFLPLAKEEEEEEEGSRMYTMDRHGKGIAIMCIVLLNLGSGVSWGGII